MPKTLSPSKSLLIEEEWIYGRIIHRPAGVYVGPGAQHSTSHPALSCVRREQTLPWDWLRLQAPYWDRVHSSLHPQPPQQHQRSELSYLQCQCLGLITCIDMHEIKDKLKQVSNSNGEYRGSEHL